mgnify:CR=1 FL=1
MDDKTRREAQEEIRQAWKFTGWHGLRQKEEALYEAKKTLLLRAGWRQDPNVLIHGEDLWRKELDGVLTALPIEAALRLERSNAYSEMQNEIYENHEKRALTQQGREAGPDAACPYPEGSFGQVYWEAGHKEAR